jgi:hypothetical protein
MKRITKPVVLPPKTITGVEETPEFYEETMMRIADYFTLILPRLHKDHPDYRTESTKEDLEKNAAFLFEKHNPFSILIYAVRGAPYHRHAQIGTAYPANTKPPRIPGPRQPRQWIVGEPGWPI